MKNYFGIFLVSILLLNVLVFGADTNGIWHLAQDVRAGIFGSDEGYGSFEFRETLTINSPTSQGALNIGGASDSGKTFSSIYLHDNSFDKDKTWVIAHKNAITTQREGDLVIGKWFSNTLREDLFIDGPTGNVGIGTNNPTAKLEVNGNIIANYPTLDNHLTTKKYVDEKISSSGGGVPIGTIVAFNLANCPTGWVKANGLSGSPDLRGVFIRGLDEGRGLDIGRNFGTYQIDELKSHTHLYKEFTEPWISGEPHWDVTSGSQSHNYRKIYETSATGGGETRPKNVALIYCMKVGSAPVEEVGILSTSATKVFLTDNTKDFEVGGKIYMGGKKVATEDQILGGANLLATNGYQVLPSGLIMQWGVINVYFESSGNSVTFPMTFPNQGLNVVATIQSSTTYSGSSAVYISSITNSGFKVAAEDSYTANKGNFNIYWQAIGY